MIKRPSLLVCAMALVLSGCALTIGSQSRGNNPGIEQDISSTRDNGPTPGNLEAPVIDQAATPTTPPPPRP